MSPSAPISNFNKQTSKQKQKEASSPKKDQSPKQAVPLTTFEVNPPELKRSLVHQIAQQHSFKNPPGQYHGQQTPKKVKHEIERAKREVVARRASSLDAGSKRKSSNAVHRYDDSDEEDTYQLKKRSVAHAIPAMMTDHADNEDDELVKIMENV